MIRNPAVAGSFYYYDPIMLSDQIADCVNAKQKKVTALGAVSPHAGYMYSGRVAGLVYSRIKIPDTLVILGPNHTGVGHDFSIMSEGVWKTPLGDVRVDSILANEVFTRSKILEDDFTAHQREHSIEVQLPFIQYFRKDAQIVPICVRHYPPGDSFLESCRDVGAAIASAIKKVGERVMVVASTDFSHYETREVAEENDGKALDAILNLSDEKLFEVVREHRISMCGYGPTAAVVHACKTLGAKKAELVEYMTSGDVTGDYDQVVGYGGVIIK